LVLAGAVFGWWQLKDVSKPPFKAHPVESDRLARDADCDNPAPRPDLAKPGGSSELMSGCDLVDRASSRGGKDEAATPLLAITSIKQPSISGPASSAFSAHWVCRNGRSQCSRRTQPGTGHSAGACADAVDNEPRGDFGFDSPDLMRAGMVALKRRNPGCISPSEVKAVLIHEAWMTLTPTP